MRSALATLALGTAVLVFTNTIATAQCFDISPSESSNASMRIGSLLINKCTGETWVLFTFQEGQVAKLRWFPISKQSDEVQWNASPRAERGQ